MGRRAEGHRAVRGTLVSQDVALPDRRQHGEDARRARVAERSVLFARRRRRRGTVDADRFIGSGERFPGHWAVPPQAWAPEGRLLADETLEVVERAIDKLPPAQRAVITMRDVQGFTSEEVCNALDLTETNQRVLLHRARAKVRSALEEYMR